VDDVATDGALVDAEPGRQVADRAGAAALQISSRASIRIVGRVTAEVSR
jgi:hypothetical protein